MSDWRAELQRCIRCGECRKVCPVFSVTLLETDVARGRLLRIEWMDQTDRISTADRNSLTRCLQCGRCTQACKSGVRVADIVRQAKQLAGCAEGLIKQTAFQAVTDPERMEHLSKNARRFAGWIGRKTPDGSGLRIRFALPYLERGRYLPLPPEKSFLEKNTGRIAEGERNIALFTGCGAGRLFDGIGEAIDGILGKMGFTLAVPPQSCCGLPAYGAGDIDSAKEAAINWLSAFDTGAYHTILSPCASCTAHLQIHLPEILAGTQYADDASRVAARVDDIFVWLAQNDWRVDLTGMRVAIHVPCHSRMGVRGGDALNGLIKRCGATVIELPSELDQACCGMGGTFGVFHPELSREIGTRKVKAILDAQPDVLVTSCTGCLLQLRDLVDRLGASLPVKHGVEILRA